MYYIATVILFCVETFPETECSSNAIAFIKTFEGCMDFKCVGYFEHNVYLLMRLENIENITILYRFNVCITTLLNFSPVRQYKKKLIAKFQ